MDDIYRNDLNSIKYIQWNQLKDIVMYTSSETVLFNQRAFYFRMMHKTINRLIDVGVIRHLVKTHLKKSKPPIVEKQPNVLNTSDLEFGFNVWLGFCGISITAFVLEVLYKLCCTSQKLRKCTYAKVHPLQTSNATDPKKIKVCNVVNYNQFKVKKKQR